LQKNELIEGYARLYDDRELAKAEVDKIFYNIDINHNEAIDFSEFLMANMQKQNIMHKDMLRAAFEAFDTDGNGVITLDELENLFQIPTSSNREHQRNDICELFKNVDLNGDGNVDFDEFLKMMESMQI
jgi:Ca2+-binding EF-hand superfamily protein